MRASEELSDGEYELSVESEGLTSPSSDGGSSSGSPSSAGSASPEDAFVPRLVSIAERVDSEAGSEEGSEEGRVWVEQLERRRDKPSEPLVRAIDARLGPPTACHDRAQAPCRDGADPSRRMRFDSSHLGSQALSV